MKKISLADIAKTLNTTPSTVSRALADHPRISESMREKVKQAANDLGYIPNPVASGFRTGKVKTIGVIVPMINRHYFSNVICGIEKVAMQAGYNVMICQTDASIERESSTINMLISNKVSGVIISSSADRSEVDHLQRVIDYDIKLVQFDRVLDGVQSSRVINSDRDGAYNTVSHLIEQGYQKIAFFNGSTKYNTYRERARGYFEAMADHGLNVSEALHVKDTNTKEEGRKATQALLDSGKHFDAIFCSGDYAALGALLLLQEKSISVPEAVGLAGFANEPFTELTSPSITSSEQHSSKMGEIAAKTVIREIENDVPISDIQIEAALIVRASSKLK